MVIKRKKIVLVTGGFDPLHSGHISLFKDASKLGGELIVGINSDKWLIRKKGVFFLPQNERKIVIENLKMVNKVIFWDDEDNTACKAIEHLLSNLKKDQILVFANGGDRKIKNTPEFIKFNNNNKVLFEFSVGGDSKLNSSSKIIENYNKKLLNKIS